MSRGPDLDHLYYSRRWRRVRRHQLRVEPLCKYCLERGIVTPATVVDHVTPHRSDVNAFWLGALQSLCKNCHDGMKQEIDKRGYSTEIGIDGMPTDPRHPCYR